MNKKIVHKFMKAMLVVSIAVTIVGSGISINSINAKAETTQVYGESGTYADEIQYEKMTSEFKEMWNQNGTGSAPKKEGYVFGGWCVCTTSDDKTTYSMLDKNEATSMKRDEAATVYAKFVPAYVLSVKAQVDEATAESQGARTNLGSIRLISSVDSEEYQKVGFQVFLNNNPENEVLNDEDGPLETTRLYTGLKKKPTDTTPIVPSQIFGSKSAFLSVWRLDEIVVDNDAKIINVTPYWITLDGTKVMGLTKYVHIEDGYKDNAFISVPINMHGKSAVAAGILTLTYPEGLELVEEKTESDDVFAKSKVTVYDAGNGTIKIVGRADTVGENVLPDGIFVNLRFRKTSASDYTSCSGAFLNFNINDKKFANWNETYIENVIVGHIQY